MRFMKDIMSHPVITVDTATTVQDAAKLMAKKNIGSVVVLTGNRLEGILTERDISKKIVAENQDPSKVKVKDVMHSPVVSADPKTSVYAASDILSKGGFRRLPIVKNEKLVGIATQTDIEMALREQTIDELNTKIHELEMFNKMAIGRELKMAELKKRVRELEGKSNK